ncbi:MAG: response regulator transcription factor [Deltaproteobacteria bacterium]|nr:response regulator transcription factor [Deltaproteobacteria bacterium]
MSQDGLADGETILDLDEPTLLDAVREIGSPKSASVFTDEARLPRGASPRLLLISGDEPAVERLLAGFGDLAVTRARTREGALGYLSRHPDSVVLVDLAAPGSLELLGEIGKQSPRARRVLWAEYEDLNTLLKSRANEVASLVMLKNAKPEAARRAMLRVLAQTAAIEAQQASSLTLEEGELLLRSTVTLLVQVPDRVIRPIAAGSATAELQLVLPNGPDLARVRGTALESWGAPLGPNDRHPLVERLGGLREGQTVCVRRIEADEPLWVYVLFMPWERDRRVTAAVGFVAARPDDAHRRAIEELRDLATTEISSLFLPEWNRSKANEPLVRYSTAYDVVVTEGYVGPDRRGGPTSLLNRFMFVGKRAYAPPNLVKLTELFVDRPSLKVRWYLVAYSVLFLLDTVATLAFIRHGTKTELNPVLRPLLGSYPLAFLAAKSTLAFVPFLFVVRLELLRIGRILLPLTTLGYAGLDAYWAWLLLVRG